MFSLHRVLLQAVFQLRQLVKNYTLAGNSFYFFDISIVEAKNIINIILKYIPFWCLVGVFTVLPNARVGLTELQGEDRERGLKGHWQHQELGTLMHSLGGNMKHKATAWGWQNREKSGLPSSEVEINLLQW